MCTVYMTLTHNFDSLEMFVEMIDRPFLKFSQNKQAFSMLEYLCVCVCFFPARSNE